MIGPPGAGKTMLAKRLPTFEINSCAAVLIAIGTRHWVCFHVMSRFYSFKI
ncbi:MAG: ATP-binding protein [Bacteroidales bacterium]|nr:ATP-binding protein [Bacteroidales bacterium]